MSYRSSLFILDASMFIVPPYLDTGFSLKLPLHISAKRSFLPPPDESERLGVSGGGGDKAVSGGGGGGGGKLSSLIEVLKLV